MRGLCAIHVLETKKSSGVNLKRRCLCRKVNNFGLVNIAWFWMNLRRSLGPMRLEPFVIRASELMVHSSSLESGSYHLTPVVSILLTGLSKIVVGTPIPVVLEGIKAISVQLQFVLSSSSTS